MEFAIVRISPKRIQIFGRQCADCDFEPVTKPLDNREFANKVLDQLRNREERHCDSDVRSVLID